MYRSNSSRKPSHWTCCRIRPRTPNRGIYLVAPLLAGTDPVVLVDREFGVDDAGVAHRVVLVLAPTHVRPLTEQKDYVLAVARRGFRQYPDLCSPRWRGVWMFIGTPDENTGSSLLRAGSKVDRASLGTDGAAGCSRLSRSVCLRSLPPDANPVAAGIRRTYRRLSTARLSRRAWSSRRRTAPEYISLFLVSSSLCIMYSDLYYTLCVHIYLT
jgi:hypothetical protein